MELSQLVSPDRTVSDSETIAIQSISRGALMKLAASKEIPFHPQSTKDQMLNILKAHGIDVARPVDGIDWGPVTYRDAQGNQQTYMAPIRPEGQSARMGEDSQGALLHKLSELEEDTKEKEAELEAVREENEKLRELLQRVEALESKHFPLEKLLHWQLLQMAADLGVTPEEIEASGASKSNTRPIIDLIRQRQ